MNTPDDKPPLVVFGSLGIAAHGSHVPPTVKIEVGPAFVLGLKLGRTIVDAVYSEKA